MTTRPMFRFLVGIALLLGGAVHLAVPGAAREEARHCVADAEAGAGEPACFASFAESIAAATGGRVRLDRDARPGDLTDRALERDAAARGIGVANSGKTIIGIAYADPRFRGNSLAISATNPAGCRSQSGRSFKVASLSRDWNDQIESLNGYQGCTDNTLFKHINFRGALARCTPGCYNLHDAEDEGSSLIFSCRPDRAQPDFCRATE